MDSNSNQARNLRILAIGFLPPPLGGISVSFRSFCDIVSKRGDVDLRVINLSGIRLKGGLICGIIRVVRQSWCGIGWSDIVTLYCATPQVPTLALVIWAFCRLRRKPFILRKAAGMDHLDLGPISGRVAEFVVGHADLFLAQTKQLVEKCRSRGIERVEWYPTSRPLCPLISRRTLCRRFVYIGQIRPSKGIFELIAASDRLSDGVYIDVYGPFYDGMNEKLLHSRSRISYKGILSPNNVVETLKEYDAFVLPSKALTEGYPGAILEALSVGLPIISTTVGGIPEIVNDKCGILIEPGNEEALLQAMRHLITDENVYQSLCRGVREAREQFSSEYWTDWLVQQCTQISVKA